MTVKAIVCLDETPDFENLFDSVGISESLTLLMSSALVTDIAMVDVIGLAINGTLGDQVDVDSTGYSVSQLQGNVPVQIVDNMGPQEISFGRGENVSLSEIGSYSVDDFNTGATEAFSMGESIAFAAEKSGTESVQTNETGVYFKMNNGMFNNEQFGSSQFNSGS